VHGEVDWLADGLRARERRGERGRFSYPLNQVVAIIDDAPNLALP
jgi:hypothetical protein